MNAATVDLRVRWLGRIEFARALALQEEIVLKKRDDCSVEDQLLGTRARTGLHHWADARSIQFVRRRTDSPWGTGRRAFAASSFRHQSRRPGNLSRAGTANGLSDYRFARNAVRICTNICAGSNNCSLIFSLNTGLLLAGGNRLPEFGSATARSLQSA